MDIETVNVKSDVAGHNGYVTINKSDFVKGTHELYKGETAPAPAPPHVTTAEATPGAAADGAQGAGWGQQPPATGEAATGDAGGAGAASGDAATA